MIVIACLGNPGKQYARNRHNAGYLAGEYLAAAHGISLKEKKFSSLCGSGTIGGEKTIILLPQTFMNNSGTAVQAALDYHQAGAESLVAVHDDIELPFGEIRAKFGGGHKGQNGIRSIIQHIGTADFHRIRIGVGRPPHPDMAVADYLLSNFTAGEMEELAGRLPLAEEMLLTIIGKNSQV